MNPQLVDIVGYTGLVVNLFSMALSGEKKLRLFSLAANTVYILYGLLLGALPIIIGSSIAVLLHSYRLRNILRKPDNTHF